MNKLILTRRLFTPYFSLHILFSILAITCLALGFSPVGKFHVTFTVNQNLAFSLIFTGLLFFALAFRGNYPSLKALHKAVAVALGIVPTVFLFLSACLLLLAEAAQAMGGIFVGELPIGQFLKDIAPTLLFFCLSASVTTGVWLIIVRRVFAQYRSPYELDSESQFASVAVLLMLFGVLGAHRFFVGRIFSGILYFMTLGFAGVGVIVDGIMLLCGTFRDSEGNIV